MRQERAPKTRGSIDFGSIRQSGGSIDGFTILVDGTVMPDGVEVLEGEAERVHDLVAARAGGLGTMLIHSLTHRAHFSAFSRFLQRRHVGRRWSGRRAQNVAEYPFSADHGGRAVRIRSNREHTALAEQSAAGFIWESHPAELA